MVSLLILHSFVPYPGIEHWSPVWQVKSLPLNHQGMTFKSLVIFLKFFHCYTFKYQTLVLQEGRNINALSVDSCNGRILKSINSSWYGTEFCLIFSCRIFWLRRLSVPGINRIVPENLAIGARFFYCRLWQGLRGSFSLVYHFLSLYFTGGKCRSTDWILKHVTLAKLS